MRFDNYSGWCVGWIIVPVFADQAGETSCFCRSMVMIFAAAVIAFLQSHESKAAIVTFTGSNGNPGTNGTRGDPGTDGADGDPGSPDPAPADASGNADPSNDARRPAAMAATAETAAMVTRVSIRMPRPAMAATAARAPMRRQPRSRFRAWLFHQRRLRLREAAMAGC